MYVGPPLKQTDCDSRGSSHVDYLVISNSPHHVAGPKDRPSRGQVGEGDEINTITCFHVPGAVLSCRHKMVNYFICVLVPQPDKSLRVWVAVVILILNQEKQVPRG